MKIVRAENLNEFKNPKYEKRTIKEELIDDNTSVFIDGHKVSLWDEKNMSFEKDYEQLINETIEENKIKVEIILTKKQYELWNKKGGEKWLKKKLVGQ